jgi:hypothetical protein
MPLFIAFLKERKPKSVKEMIELGDQYLASHLYHSGEGKIMKFGSNNVQDQSHGKPHFKKESSKSTGRHTWSSVHSILKMSHQQPSCCF